MSKWIIRDIAPGIAEKELLNATVGCYSYENHEAHGLNSFDVTYIGRLYAEGMPEYVYEIYREANGSYWYKSMILKNGKLIDAHEAIFSGRKHEARYGRYKK